MSINELELRIAELKEWEALIAEAEAAAETIKDQIKAEMSQQNVSELEAGRYIVRWTQVISNRFDTTNFKNVYPDMYRSFTKATTIRRFTIS